MGYYEGEIGSLCGNNNNNGWNDWSWIIGLAVVGGIFGNGGFGFGNGGNRGNCATQADLSAGFANSAVLSNLNDIILGQATMQNFINQGFAGLNATINSGFAGVDNAVCTLGYNTQAGFNALSRELADCCCTTQRNIDSLRFDMSKGFCDIVRAGQDNTRAILDYLTGEKIDTLNRKLAVAENEALTYKNNAYLISQIKEPCPIPAYITPNPNCCYQYNVAPTCGSCASVM